MVCPIVVGDDIAFHFNPRFSDECVVRNAKKGGYWGPEDRRGVQPFTKGQPFVLEISCLDDRFAVSVNGMQFTEFVVRGALEGDSTLSSNNISHLHISGDVAPTKVSKMNPSTGMSYLQNPNAAKKLD